MTQDKGHKSLRKGRYSFHNGVYHLIFNTKHRYPHFSNFSFARLFIQILKAEQEIGYADSLAFVIMPDHVHWLMQLKQGSVDQSVQRVKGLMTRSIGFSVWASGFYDHAIRSDENLKNVARYIVANPLRAGLVKSVGEYPHWDAVWL